MDRRKLTVIFLIVFVDVFGFGIALPLLGPWAIRLGASPFVAGLLGSSYALASMVGSPVLGRLSDRYGRRPILLVSIFGTFVGFVILMFAQSLWVLFLSRIIDGLTAGNFVVAQSYITDVTDAENRARGLGLTGAAFGLGFILGPTAGGLLARFGFWAPAAAAAAMSLLNLGLVFGLLPESLSEERKRELAAQPAGGFTLGRLTRALREPRFGPALILRGGFWFAFAVFQGVFSIWAVERLNASVTQIGATLAYVGLMSVLVQLVFIKPLTRRFSEGWLAVVALGVSGAGFLAWAFTPSLWLTFVMLTPLTIAIAIENTVASSLLSKSVKPWEIGGAFGLAGTLQNAGSAVAPALGGALLQSVGFWAPGVLAALLAFALLPYVYREFGRSTRGLDESQVPPAEQAGPGPAD